MRVSFRTPLYVTPASEYPHSPEYREFAERVIDTLAEAYESYAEGCVEDAAMQVMDAKERIEYASDDNVIPYLRGQVTDVVMTVAPIDYVYASTTRIRSGDVDWTNLYCALSLLAKELWEKQVHYHVIVGDETKPAQFSDYSLAVRAVIGKLTGKSSTERLEAFNRAQGRIVTCLTDSGCKVKGGDVECLDW